MLLERIGLPQARPLRLRRRPGVKQPQVAGHVCCVAFRRTADPQRLFAVRLTTRAPSKELKMPKGKEVRKPKKEALPKQNASNPAKGVSPAPPKKK
jgi:hypothetical protein